MRIDKVIDRQFLTRPTHLPTISRYVTISQKIFTIVRNPLIMMMMTKSPTGNSHPWSIPPHHLQIFYNFSSHIHHFSDIHFWESHPALILAIPRYQFLILYSQLFILVLCLQSSLISFLGQRCKKRKNSRGRPFFSKELAQHILAYSLRRQPKN